MNAKTIAASKNMGQIARVDAQGLCASNRANGHGTRRRHLARLLVGAPQVARVRRSVTSMLVMPWLAAGWLAAGIASAQPAAHDIPAAGGAEAYLASGCSVCHGIDGAGTAAGPRLARTPPGLEDFTAFVRRPVRSMPAYPVQVIPDEDLAAMHAWLLAVELPELPEGQIAAGAGAYQANGCYQCHANEAQGGMHGPRLGPDPISLPRFIWYARHPSATMPPYSEQVLPTETLVDIHAFLSAQPPPRPLGTIPLLAP
jgi:mono/diheme cytochrome c family protein